MKISKKILMVVTSHAKLGSTGKATGYYLPELSHPAAIFSKAGIDFDIASPLGGKAPMDQGSRDLSDEMNRSFLEKHEAQIENTIPATAIKAQNYDAIFYAGGHGTMWDFPVDSNLAQIAKAIYENGGVVAAVCHGPAALVNIRLSSGQYIVNGKQITGFSNKEEEAAGLTKVMPFLLEDKLRTQGGFFSSASPWQEHVVTDGRLVTGQNPASALGVARSVVQILGQAAK